MATPEEVRRLLSDVTAVAPYTGGPVNLQPPQAEQPVYVGYGLYFVPSTQSYVKAQRSDFPDSETGQYYTAWVPATPSEIAALEKALEGEAGPAGRDPVLARLTEEQILSEQAAREIAASEEARAAEMQPYDIANVQSAIEARKAQEEYDQKNLERQMVSDKFDRAQEIFNSSFLAQQLAEEKKKTATSLLTSIVDNLVPPGMTSLPGIPGSTMPTVAQIDWNQLGGGLDPQTDQALQYLLGMQQQNAGV